MTPRARRAIPLTLVGALLCLAPAAAYAGTTEPADPPTLAPTDPGLTQQIEADQEIATDDVVLDLGHVDLGPRFRDGEWTLMVHDDTRVEGSVWRPLEHAVVRVSDAALQEVPDDPAYSFLGAEPGAPVHVVPQTQDTEVVWLGWNTQDPETLERVDRGVTMSLAGVEGPGDLVVFLQDGGFGAPDLLWSSRPGEGGPLYVEVGTHTHANWVFSEPGVYAVAIEVTATLLDGTEATTTGTVRFAVGDAADPADALALADVAAPADGDPAADAAPAAAPDADEDGGGRAAVVALAVVAVLLVLAAVLVAARGRSARRRALASGPDLGGHA